MMVYNRTWFANLHKQTDAEQQHQRANISAAELNAVKLKYPTGFYAPGIFVRAGLFILTCIGASFSGSLLSVLLLEAHIIESYIWPIFLGIAACFALEMMIRNNHYFRAGVDDALLYISAGLVAGGLVWMIYTLPVTDEAKNICIALLTCLLCTACAIRYVDSLVAAMATVAAFAFTFFAWQLTGKLGMTTMPFMMMLVAVCIYWFNNRLSNKPESIDYSYCLLIVKAISLLVLYAAGNYFVVQKLSSELNGTPGNTPVPFGGIFWIWTIILPFAYICWGIFKKSMLLIRTGLFLIVGTILTFRNYYHLLPVELMLTIAGAVLSIAVYALIKYLNEPKYGFTYEDIDNSNARSFKLESLVIGETFSDLPAAPQQPGNIFGGGSAGGGGSSSNY